MHTTPQSQFLSKKTIVLCATSRWACLVLAAFAWSSSLLPAQEVSPADRPNMLLCLSDDQSYPHASAYGEPVIKTPVFDRVAREGVLFTQAYCAAPSCTPSRSAILTGQDIWRLGEGGHPPPVVGRGGMDVRAWVPLFCGTTKHGYCGCSAPGVIRWLRPRRVRLTAISSYRLTGGCCAH
jgi:hypothetical protein